MKKSKSPKTTDGKKSAAEKEIADDLSGKPAMPEDFLIVGIGASAGGIQVLKEFFENVPADSGMAYVVILHLSPDHDSRLAEVLQTTAAIPVKKVTEKVRVVPNNVYVVPPNEHLEMVDGHLVVTPNTSIEERRAPVDIFFRTLAESHHARAVAVVLSGTGANGSMGIKRIKERGGAAFVQNPREAEFSEMPRNSIATDLIDQVLNVAEIPKRIIAYKQSLGKVEISVEPEQRPEEQQQFLRDIFTTLRLRTGHDFSNYKRPTILRRIERRINVFDLPDLTTYAAFVRDNRDEASALLKDLLISVTNFFRDRQPFDYLETEILPKIFHGKTPEDQVRIWVAGCATGEEAYSLAMLCAERTLGAFEAPTVQIFASDIDEQAIATAREGLYTLNDAADVSPERLRRFFTKEGDGYRVRRELREMILFASHNVIKDPPFSKLDLATCRNMLIYLNQTAQERVMETFHFALNPGGYLFLGNSESVDGAGDLYATVSKENHVFQSRMASGRVFYPVPDAAGGRFRNRESGGALALPAAALTTKPEIEKIAPFQRQSFGDLHQQLLEQYAPPSIIVNEEYEILHLSENAGRFLQVVGGEPTKNLLKLIRPELRLELRAGLYQAVQNQTSVEVKNLKISAGAGDERINIHARPVLQRSEDTARGFILVLFETLREGAGDLPTDAIVLSEKLSASQEPLARQLEEELVRTKSQLRGTIEQFEIQAEELKASNEELQAMNEELRSAAEELETSKEELQSVNEELITVNQELKVKLEELSLSNNDFQNLINSTDVATIFLDRSFRVHTFTPAASRIFNLIPADFGRPITDITHRLETDELLADAEKVLDTLQTVERETRTIDGRTYLLRVLPYRTSEDRINGVVATFLDITARKLAEESVRRSGERLQRAINIETVGVIFFNNKIEITDCNEAFLRMCGFTAEELRAGRFSWEFFTPEEFIEPSCRAIEELNANGISTPYEKEYIRKDGSRFWALFACKRIGENEIVEFVTDITEQKQAEKSVRESEEKYRTLFDSIDEGFAIYELKRDEYGNVVDMLYHETNEAYERLTGLKNVVGRWASELLPNLEPSWSEKIRQVADTGIAIRMEDYVHELDRWFSVHQSRIGGAGSNLIASVFDNITERKRREANQALLVEIADDLTRLTTTDEIMNAVGRRLGERLNLSSCAFADVDDEDGLAVINHGWQKADAPKLINQTHRTADYLTEEYDRANRAGKTIIVRDTATDERTDAAAYERVKVRAFVVVPFLREKRWTGNLTALSETARDWRTDEIELVEEIAARVFPRVERARAEEALRRADERYRAMTDNVPVLIWETDESGLIFSNRHYTDFFGVSFEEVREMGWAKFLHPDDFEGYAAAYRKAFERGESYSYECRFRRADGEYRWLLNTGHPLNEIRFVGFSADITENKRAAEALRESESRLHSIANLVPDLLWDSEADGATRWYNRRWLEYTGQSFEEAIGWGWREAIHPDDRETSAHGYRATVETGEKLRQEHRIRRYDGEYRWFVVNTFPLKDESGKVVKMYGAATDIHELRLMNEALRESEELFRLASDAVPAVLYDWNVPEDRITRSGELENLLGFSPDEPQTQTNEWWKTRLHPEDAERAIETVVEKLASDDYRFEDEYRVQHLDGHYVWVSDTGVLLRDEAGQVSRWVGSITGITGRKEVAEALRQSEERLRAIFNQATAGVGQTDLNGKFTFVNQALCDITGYSRDELRDLTLKDITFPEDFDANAHLLGGLIERGESFIAEKRYIRKNGTFIWVQNSVSAIYDADGKINALLVVSIDSNERKLISEALHESEERLRIAVEAAEMGTWDWNLTTDEVRWNERHFLLFGMKPRQNPISSAEFFDHIHPQDRRRVKKLLKQAVKNKTTFVAEFCIIRDDGKTRWMEGYGHTVEEVKGKTVRMSGVMSDVTNRKNAAEALRKSEEQLQLILESTKEYAIITFDLDGTITRWNTGAKKTFGYTEKEMLGKKGDVLFTPEDRAAKIPAKELEAALKKGRAEDERWHLRKDGSRFFASGVMQPLKDGEIEGFVKIARDQTERLAAETALREKETLQKLVTAQEGERKRIARDLHDELGQQLTALRIKLDSVGKLCEGDEKLRDTIDETQLIAKELDAGIDFLAWELRPAALDDFGLRAALIKYVKEWSRYSGIAAEFISPAVKIDRLPPEVETNLYRIAQEALNNVHKHAKAKTVEVSLEKRGKDLIVLIIADNGKGFNVKSKMNRTKGIGLIGMEERAILVGGNLEIESATGGGTTVYIRVPATGVKKEKRSDE